MEKKSFALVVMLILIAQPLVITSNLTIVGLQAALQEDNAIVLSQDYGTRLTPEEHLNHVPIVINSTLDFTLQSWQGDGSEGNPFVIAGLNITYNHPDYLIKITNVDDYFLIEDCFLRQLSGSGSILIENVTHATIQYVTIISESGGIDVTNAPGTYIYYAYVESTGYYALNVNKATDLNLYHSLYNSSASSAVWLNATEAAVINDMIFDSEYPYTDLFISYSDYVSLHNAEFHVSSIELYLTYCNSFFAENLFATHGDYGIQMYNCNDTIIHDADITADFDALTIVTCNNVIVTDSTFSNNVGGQAIGVSTSSWISFDNIFVYDTGNMGMQFASCDNVSVSNSEFSNIPGECIWLTSTPDSNILSNHFENIGDTTIGMTAASHRGNVSINTLINVFDGLYVADSDNGTFSFNSISVAEHGFYSDTSFWWQIHDNVIEKTFAGIYVFTGGSFHDIWNNAISMAEYGMYILGHGVIELWDNTVTDCTTGLYLEGCDYQYVRDNIITNCETGMYQETTVDSTINDNIITNCEQDGIYLIEVDTTEFTGNNISNCVRSGIYFYSGIYDTFNDNNLDGCGFNFLEFPSSVQKFNHSFSGNLINGLPLYYAISETGLSIDGYNWGQVILINCTYSTVSNGYFDSCTSAVQINFGHDIDVSGLYCENLWMPVYSQMADNVSILSSEFVGNADQNGIFAWASDYIWIENCNFTGIGGDWQNYDCAIKFGDFNYFTVIDCNFLDIAGYAIGASDGSITSGSNGEIIDCTFINATAAIYGYDAQYINVTNCYIQWCPFGLFGDVSDYWRVEWNTILDGGIGIYIYISWDWFTANNTIMWNNVGINMLDTFSPGITADNIIALNFMDNGFDNTFRYWDDGVDTGNYWDDWAGTGIYPVGGSGGAQDRYPMQYVVTEPIINSPQDIWIAEGSVGNEIVWLPYDNFLRDWTVTMDGGAWASGAWNFENVTVNIDGLAYGTHTVFITVWDVDNNYVNDTVIIHVYDDTPPDIEGPADHILFVDADMTIDWDTFDLNPADYDVTVDDVEFATGTWTSGILSVDFNGIATGEHNITMTIYDADGNMASDLVVVLVVDDGTAPEIDHPADVVYIVGTTGNNIVWSPQDEYPYSFLIERNNTIAADGMWGGSRITINVDGLAVGNHSYRLTVYDRGGNQNTDTVVVIVEPLIQEPEVLAVDWVILIIIGTVIGAVVVVVAIVYYLKKKRPSS
ncbi:MAG: right-handed parallel beta-helix repeat-containing protein [Candidatus Thorarchaeota archaeon]